jgi:hypothetical protein
MPSCAAAGEGLVMERSRQPGPFTRRAEELRRFAAERHFVTGRSELLERGFPLTTIRSWGDNERLTRLFHGVYSYGRDVETREAAWRAALLAGGPGSALTARSALEVWGAIEPRDPIPRLIFVATEVDRGAEHYGKSAALTQTKVKVVRRTLEAEDIRERSGLRVVRAAFALIDFAATASEREVRSAYLELCRLELFDRKDLAYCFRRMAGRRGVSKLRPLLALWVPELARTRSVFEGLFVLAWGETRRPTPKVNQRIFGREVDFLWPEHGVVVELDGAAFHSDPLASRRDQEKTDFLESKGLRVTRVSWKEFEADQDAVLAGIARQIS